MRLSSLLLFATCLAGCSVEIPKPSQPNAVQTQSDPIVASDSDFSIPAVIESTLEADERPNSADEFVRTFAELSKAGPVDAFMQLAYWGDMPQEARKAMMEEFVVGYDSSHLIEEDLNLTPFADYEYGFSPDTNNKRLLIEPTHVLQVAFGDDSGSVTDYVAIGEHEGKFYFCTAIEE